MSEAKKPGDNIEIVLPGAQLTVTEASCPEGCSLVTDKQMIELGGQLDVPWHLAWSCRMHADRPCRVCAGCRRRIRSFESAGMSDPLDESASVR